MIRALVAVAAVFALSACTSQTADIAAVESNIKSGLHDQLGGRYSVNCPDKVEWKVGGDFHCIASDGQGNQSRITVSMENDDGDVTWVVG